ncbi:unnamed protein product [marine sediment metagenome]|uniref:Ankyrin repeat protein n=1 Tax=marine sediment metagenome TaxID=412755 RepID=X1BNX9_9ZZZZ
MMLTRYKDVDLYEILMNLDDESLLNFCKSAVKQEYEKSLCADETFWKLRMKNYYPSYYHLNNQSWKDFYLKMVYYLSKLEELSGIPYISSEYKLYINSQKSMLNMAMNYASDSGQMDIVELMVKKGADNYNLAIIYAAEAGYMDIINYFIEKGANNWNGAIGGAAKGGHMNIIQFLLTKNPNNLNPGLLGAIKGGHNDILNL